MKSIIRYALMALAMLGFSFTAIADETTATDQQNSQQTAVTPAEQLMTIDAPAMMIEGIELATPAVTVQVGEFVIQQGWTELTDQTHIDRALEKAGYRMANKEEKEKFLSAHKIEPRSFNQHPLIVAKKTQPAAEPTRVALAQPSASTES